MAVLDKEHVAAYLASAREIAQTEPLYDMHVHPYEVLFDSLRYGEMSSGVQSREGTAYVPSVTGRYGVPDADESAREPFSTRLQLIGRMQCASTYAHVGGRVVVDQMDLGSISRALLLPVAKPGGDIEGRLRWVRESYTDPHRFKVAGSICRDVGIEEIPVYLGRQVEKFGVTALKCHPVISDIDVCGDDGREWLEAVVTTCGDLGLPLILHTGRNSPYWEGARGEYGSLAGLSAVNWTLARSPVVLAHGGVHRCTTLEAEQEVLPLLGRMLDACSSLFVDISGLGLQSMVLLVKRVPLDRILFGSDALYAPVWGAVAMTLHALRESGYGPDGFSRIAGCNPRTLIFKE